MKGEAVTGGPMDGFVECEQLGCPSWDDNATPEAVREFEDSDGWAHGIRHVHFIDHYVIDPSDGVATDAAVRAERERIRAMLSLPMLQALRLIPTGTVQQGCVVSDGTVVRQRLRAAYFAITADSAPTPPLDLAEVAPWMELCGHCDAGLPQSCTCPSGDPRVVIAALVDEIVKQRQEAQQ